MPGYVAKRAEEILAGTADPKVCILGATYKPDVDDMRESPILHLVDELRAKGIEVAVHDPHAAKRPGIEGDLLKAAEGADLVILGVNHKQFKELDYGALAGVVRQKNFLDTRNFADKAAVEAAGFAYYLLGK